MSFRTCLLLAYLIFLCSACSELAETGRSISENNGIMMDSEVESLGGRKYRITVTGSSVFFDGQAEAFFNRRADEYTHDQGCKSWTLQEFKMGIENTLLGARRYATGVVQCT